MLARDKSLIAEIEGDVLDPTSALADVLRKCIVLGGEAGSTQLRKWAAGELRGYKNKDELPAYRRLSAVLQVDAISGFYQISGQQISPRALPEGIAEHVAEEVPMSEGIGEIEALAEQAKAKGGFARITLMEAATVARLMDAEVGNPHQHITAIYWTISESAIRGLVDQVRTILAELVGEMRAGMPHTETTPSAAVADQAVNVAVYGSRSRVKVTTAQAGGPNENGMSAIAGSGGESRWRKIGALVVGGATIIGVVIALAQWQGWGL
jgi:hypothetical protein